jgi:hypothetical protein
MTLKVNIPIRLQFCVVLLAFTMAVSAVAGPPETVDADKVVALVGRFAIAHACPISENYALTAAHVTDVRWFDNDFALVPYRYENGYGEYGIAKPAGVFSSSDIGWLHFPSGVSHFRIASTRPLIGDKVYWVEFNLSNKRKAITPKVEDGKIVNIVAGTIYIDRAPVVGASGGCLLNAGKIGSSNTYNVGAIVGIYPPWTPDLPGEKDEEEGSEES